MTAYHITHCKGHNVSWSARRTGANRAAKRFEMIDEALNWTRKRADIIYVHGEDGRIADRIDSGQMRDQINTILPRMREWLGDSGEQFFRGLVDKHGEIPLCPDGHPLHLREGMQVRNWLRSQPECVHWDMTETEFFDYIYMEMLYRSLDLPILCPITGELVDLD